jgi:hypothetical protein
MKRAREKERKRDFFVTDTIFDLKHWREREGEGERGRKKEKEGERQRERERERERERGREAERERERERERKKKREREEIGGERGREGGQRLELTEGEIENSIQRQTDRDRK